VYTGYGRLDPKELSLWHDQKALKTPNTNPSLGKSSNPNKKRFSKKEKERE